jgi:NAD(P)-dependent dehydrogenase (short-subunit alcohol dehydrogenase family)
MSKPICVVVGVGPGKGAYLARRFAAEGHGVALVALVAFVARTTELTSLLAKELPGSRAYECDVADEASVERTFAAVAAEMGAAEVLVYNAGSGVGGNVCDRRGSTWQS